MGAPVRLAAGSTFAADFKVGKALFEGDDRAVYAVEQISTGRPLALKILAPESVPDEASRSAFVQEVRIGGTIETPHIVDVRAAGIDEATGFPWLAMEMLTGVELTQVLKESASKPPMPGWDELLSQLLHGLSAVHAAGVAHGAIIPESVFLAQPGLAGAQFRVELLDIGMPKPARIRARNAALCAPWLAPEQTEGDGAATAANDIWTVGLLTFKAVTGKHYLRSANGSKIDPAAVAAELKAGDFPAASARAKEVGFTGQLPKGFDAWFARCVARSPGERWGDAAKALDGAADMLTAVSEVDTSEVAEAADEPPPTRGKGPPPLPPMMKRIAENPKPAIFAIVVLVGLALAGGFGLGALRGASGKATSEKARTKAATFAMKPVEEVTKACEGGDASACHGLALIYSQGTKVTKDDPKATGLFSKACDGGDMAACNGLASRYLNGEGATEDKPKAVALYKKACDAGDLVSCVDLADMYQNGNGVKKDEAQAKSLYEKACKEGFTDVCK